jgi:hypothetical protein
MNEVLISNPTYESMDNMIVGGMVDLVLSVGETLDVVMEGLTILMLVAHNLSCGNPSWFLLLQNDLLTPFKGQDVP